MGSTFVVGVDGLQEAYQKIADGTMYIGTVDNNPAEKATMILETIPRILADGPIEERINVQVAKVTAENVADYLK